MPSSSARPRSPRTSATSSSAGRHRDADRGWRRRAAADGWAAAGGLLLGLSSLARARRHRVRAAGRPVALVGGTRSRGPRACGRDLRRSPRPPVVPWTIRNAIVTGDFIPVETNGIYNLYDDNTFVEGERRREPGGGHALAADAGPAARHGGADGPGGSRASPMRSWKRPGATSSTSSVRTACSSSPRGRGAHARLAPRGRSSSSTTSSCSPAVVLFAVFLIAGRPSPERGLDRRLDCLLPADGGGPLPQRDPLPEHALLPFALAGAAGGWALLARREAVSLARARGPDPGRRARRAGWLRPYRRPGGAGSPLPARLEGDASGRREGRRRCPRAGISDEAVRADPGSARPWLRYGRALARHGDPAGALDAYETAPRAARRTSGSRSWCGRLCWPRPDGRRIVADAVAEANAFSWNVDPWLALEVAWRELPAPCHRRSAARGRRLRRAPAASAQRAPRDGRWTRHRAWLRLRPATAAPAYEVTLWMGSPAASAPRGARGPRVTTPDGTGEPLHALGARSRRSG